MNPELSAESDHSEKPALSPEYPHLLPATPVRMESGFMRGSILGAILRMGLPSIIGFVAINVYDLADIFWVAKLGPQHVAAIALFEGFYWVLTSTNEVAGLGSIAIISRRYGEGDLARTGVAIKETFILKWLCASLSAAIGLFFLRPLLGLMGAEGEVLDLGVQYGRVRLLAMGFYFGSYSVFTSLRCIEAPRQAMWLMLFGTILNLCLDPFLIFGWGSFPRLGIAGAAVASAISYALVFLLGLWLFFGDRTNVLLHWKAEVPVRLNSMLAMMKIGFPGGINAISFTLGRAVITPLIAVFGTQVVAAYGMGMRISQFGILLSFGLGMGVSPLIGNLLGANLKERVWQTARQSILLTLGIMITLALLTFGFAPAIVSAFFQSEDLLAIGVELLRIYALGLPCIGIWIMVESIFGGAGDNIPPMIISIVTSRAIEIPLILILTRIFDMDQTGVWYSIVIYAMTGALASLYWLRRGRWAQKSV